MKNRDVISSMIWAALGGLFLAGAWQQGLMRKGVPGPGFLPFLSGLGLILLSLFVLLPALSRERKDGGEEFFPERDSFRKLLSAVAALFAFGLALDYAGYLLTTFFFIFFIIRLMKPRGWRSTALVAFLTSVLSYLLFVVLLEVQLPGGPLGF